MVVPGKQLRSVYSQVVFSQGLNAAARSWSNGFSRGWREALAELPERFDAPEGRLKASGLPRLKPLLQPRLKPELRARVG